MPRHRREFLLGSIAAAGALAGCSGPTDGGDDATPTEGSLYLANQEVWVSNWGGDFYEGRGVPGQSDEPPQ